jgi:hypothetical protein
VVTAAALLVLVLVRGRRYNPSCSSESKPYLYVSSSQGTLRCFIRDPVQLGFVGHSHEYPTLGLRVSCLDNAIMKLCTGRGNRRYAALPSREGYHRMKWSMGRIQVAPRRIVEFDPLENVFRNISFQILILRMNHLLLVLSEK